MNRTIRLAAAAAAAITLTVAGTSTALAVNGGSSTPSDVLDDIRIERIAIDLQADDLCKVVRTFHAQGLDTDTLVEVGVDEFAVGWGDDFPPEAALYLAGLLTGCLS